MSWWTNNRKAYALNFLINNGLTQYGAAGLVSRWANVEAPNGPASRGGFQGRAWGIAQWLGARLSPIDGNTNFDDQLGYVVYELNNSEQRAGSLLRNALNIVQGARAATAYERASGWNASTNTDSFTQRTANGIPSVLALLASSGNLNPVVPPANPQKPRLKKQAGRKRKARSTR